MESTCAFSPTRMPERRGQLKIYLGYAAGVGKTYQMLEEAQRLKAAGTDIVIGYFEPHARKDTIEKTGGLETVPRRRVEHRGTVFEDMDTDAIIRRHPKVCVVDEFAHSNIPGSERGKRWEDVRAILDAGIDVLTTVNVQHIESLNDQVLQGTGIRVRETIPDWMMQEADELVMVDVTPRALLHRLERGVVYAPEKAQRALANFFTETNLTALRELALRQAAHQVEDRREESRAVMPQPTSFGADPDRHETIVIHLTSDPSTAMLIRRGKRVADFLHARCVAVYIAHDATWSDLSASQKEAVEKHLSFARNLHIETQILQGASVPETLVNFARVQKATQLYLARDAGEEKHQTRLTGEAKQIVKLARDMEITIVARRRR